MNNSQLPIPDDGDRVVLVVEDDELTRDSYVDFLAEICKRNGCVIVTACDGQEGLEKFRKYKEKAVLVITDNSMPRMTGRQFVTELKNAGETVPILMISGDSEVEFRQWTRNVGLRAFLPKPVSADRLLNEVQAALVQR